MEKIWLHYNNGNTRGPGMVVKNLIAGLKEIGHEVVDKPNKADLHGCLQHPGQLAMHLPRNVLMGPNLFVIPDECPEIVSKFKNFVVPSQWVKKLYSSSHSMRNKVIDVWSVGIDQAKWDICDDQKSIKNDFFIYCKGREEEARALNDYIQKNFGLSSGGILVYGNYNEEDLMRHCRESKFAFLLTGTESQGIAYMNILASNTPCYVFNKTMWVYEGNQQIKSPATSVPYFTTRCGYVDTLFDDDVFNGFLKDIHKNFYSPKNYIKNEHSLALSALKYVDLLRKSKTSNG